MRTLSKMLSWPTPQSTLNISGMIMFFRVYVSRGRVSGISIVPVFAAIVKSESSLPYLVHAASLFNRVFPIRRWKRDLQNENKQANFSSHIAGAYWLIKFATAGAMALGITLSPVVHTVNDSLKAQYKTQRST